LATVDRSVDPYRRAVAHRSDAPLDENASVEVLRARLPEFAPAIDKHLRDYEELLFHLVMGDLARFYVNEAVHNPELQRRFWMTVDRLATQGDNQVQNAIGVSLIEWFAWGNDRERALIVDAKPLMSSTVRACTDDFLRSGGYDERGLPKR
jgi:hypothetical protein